MLNNVFGILISRSLILTPIVGIFILCTPIFRKRYKAKTIYTILIILSLVFLSPLNILTDVLYKNLESSSGIPNEIMTNNRLSINPTMLSVRNITQTVNNRIISENKINIFTILSIVWLIGMIVIAIIHSIRHIQFIRLNKRWNEDFIADSRQAEILEKLFHELKITGDVGILKNELISSPMIMGVLNPQIRLPPTIVNQYNDEFELIIKHELIHYKRKDLWIKLLASIVNIVYWFNPINYLLTKLISLYSEISCDEKVVESLDLDGRQKYGETIIGVIQRQKRIKTILVNNFYGGKWGMKKRMFSIMDDFPKKKGFYIVSLSVLIIICSVVLLSPISIAANTKSEKIVNAAENVSLDTSDVSVDTTEIDAKIKELDEYIDDCFNKIMNLDPEDSKYDEKITVLNKEIEKATDQQFELNEEASDLYVKEHSKIYEKYGLKYDENTKRYNIDGKLVRYFEDNKSKSDQTFLGSLMNYDDGEVDVIVQRNANGEIEGLEVLAVKDTKDYIKDLYKNQKSNDAGADKAKSN